MNQGGERDNENVREMHNKRMTPVKCRVGQRLSARLSISHMLCSLHMLHLALIPAHREAAPQTSVGKHFQGVFFRRKTIELKKDFNLTLNIR